MYVCMVCMYVWYVCMYGMYIRITCIKSILFLRKLLHWIDYIPNCVKSASIGRGTDMDPFEFTE
jgi:hypothetical protein